MSRSFARVLGGDAGAISAASLTAAAIFAVDQVTELGIAIAVPYAASVGLTYWSKRPRLTLWIAVACSLLTVLGYALSPTGGEPLKVVANRGLALGMIWLTAMLCEWTKRAEAQLGTEEARSRAILSVSLDAVISMDADGVVLGWNPQAEVVFGWSADEAIGRDLAETIIPEADRDAHRAGLRRFLETGSGPRLNQRLEVEAMRRGGANFPAEVTITPIRSGESWQFSGFVRDITELKRAQDEIRHYAAELQRSNEDLDQFAYSASHDLKAPLRAIDNLARWIAEDAADQLPEDSRRDLGLMRQRIARMERLLEDLLSYSRVGRVEHEIEELDVGDLVQDVLFLISPPESFTVRIDPLPTLSSYRVPLEHVFANLIENAIKHHDRDDGNVEVSATPGPEFVEFTVTDDGPGIASEFHERVFGMFQTLRPRDTVEGSGMGLPLVRRIVESHGGSIELESREGAGATFRFTWPRRHDAARKPEAP